MDIIQTIEAQIIAETKAVLGNALKEVATIPGGWTMKTLERALQYAPGVYVAFHGATPSANNDYFNGKFSVYTVSSGVDEASRRHGSKRVIGAYDMLAHLVPKLSGLLVEGVGTLKVTGVDNLYRDAMFELGGTVYGIQLKMPNMQFAPIADTTTLDDFITFDATYSSEDPKPHDQLTLEQP